MQVGLLLDNCPIGQGPPPETYEKLAVMQAGAVGLLWTGGTRHGREVYERCEETLPYRGSSIGGPLYIVRVGGHVQTAAEWIRDADEALVAAPSRVLGRVVLAFGNEPNLEGWGDMPVRYGHTLAEIHRSSAFAPLFACPSAGVAGWQDWLAKAHEAAGRPGAGIANLYAGNVALVAFFRQRFAELYIGEVNDLERRGEERRRFLGEAFGTLASAGVKAALVFIAGGKAGGAWDERYIVTREEVAGLGAEVESAAASVAPNSAAAAIEDPRQGKGEGTVLIGNLEVEDLRGALPDEPGKMLPVAFTAKDFISIHHTVTPRTTTARTIYDYHKKRGWGGIGYNFLVRSDGHICYVGECNTERAAVGQIGEGNSRGLHIAFIDDLSERAPTMEALGAAKLLIANLQHTYGWWLPVVPHRIFNAGGGRWDTACPGNRWREWWPGLLRAVGE